MGIINDICSCKCKNEYLDIEKNEINIKKNSKSRQTKIKKMKKISNLMDRYEKNEILIWTKKILENIHLMSEKNKNLIKKNIVNIFLELFDKKILNEKLAIFDDILNGGNIDKVKKECVYILKLIYRRKNEINENIISSFIETLEKTLKETDNEEIIKKNEVDLFIKKLRMLFDIQLEEEISCVKFRRISTNFGNSYREFENNETNANNFLNEEELKYFYNK